MRSTLTWIFVVPASIALGLLFDYFNVAAAWILAGIIVAGGMALVRREELVLNSHVEKAGRGVIGVLAGLPLVGIGIGEVTPYVLPGLAVSIITVALGMSAGVVLAKSVKEISPQTGILCMLPGGSSTLPVIARETGADFRLVALSQYLRLLIVSLSLPLVTSIFNVTATGAAEETGTWWGALLLVVFALVGPYIGKLLHFPAPHIFAPLLLTVVAGQFIPDALVMPNFVAVIAFLIIGWFCGGGLSVQVLKIFARQLPMTLLFIIITIATCAATALLLSWWMNITYFDAYLATSPGGLETVLALAHEGGSGPAVVSVQLIRLLTLLFLAGYLSTIIRWIVKRGRG